MHEHRPAENLLMTCVIRIQICIDKETSFIEFSGKPSQSGAGFQRGTDDEFTLLCSLHTESHLSFVDYCVQNLACSNSGRQVQGSPPRVH